MSLGRRILKDVEIRGRSNFRGREGSRDSMSKFFVRLGVVRRISSKLFVVRS